MIHFTIYKTVNEIPQAWDALPTPDIFLKTPFLKALEQSSPKNITSYFLGIFKKEQLVGIAILQRVEMYADDIFRKTSNNRFKQIAKNLIAKIVRGNAIIIGNLIHTGQHGLFYLEENITQEEYLETLNKGIHQLSENINKQFQKKIRIIAFKDYFETDSIHKNTAFFNKEKLYKVQVQPNMLFIIPSHWNNNADYIQAFKKKYRDRYKRARKKGAPIKAIELNLEAIKTHSETLFELYQNVSDHAGVNSFKLAKNHFYKLKEHLQDNFKVFGCFFNQELVGFYTLIQNGKTLETYFLGYKQALQHQHQMYLNMLYNMVAFGIENKFNKIVFARTAMEIKSSIGAKPYPMLVYIKHTNQLLANKVLKLIVKYMNPIRTWEERHPFK